jgi:hypothetical protein
MFSLAAFTVAALLGSVNAAPTQDPSLGPSNAKCVRSTYSIPVSSMNVQFTNHTAPEGVDNTTFVTALQQRYAIWRNGRRISPNCSHRFVSDLPSLPNITRELETGNGTNPKRAAVSNTYKISGILCTPDTNKAPNTIQLLLHGSMCSRLHVMSDTDIFSWI